MTATQYTRQTVYDVDTIGKIYADLSPFVKYSLIPVTIDFQQAGQLLSPIVDEVQEFKNTLTERHGKARDAKYPRLMS